MTRFPMLAACAATIGPALAIPMELRGDGCAKTHQSGFNNNTENHSIESGGRTRTYAVNVPSSYNDNIGKRWPLIIDYHGHGGTPWQQYDNSMYYRYDEGQEYLVVYPQGVDGSWQGPTYATPNVNDLQFTTDLLGHIRSSYCIDDSRVYASGKSNGGGFVDTLACSDHGDEFAAFAMASAALYTDLSKGSCSKRRAILESHGDKDTTIPYHGGKGSGGQLPNIGRWVSWWGARTCPGADAARTGDLGGYNRTTYSCDSYHKIVDHYQVFDLGHCWPSTNGENYDYTKKDSPCDDYSLDFTQVVLNFFGRFDLGSVPSN